MVNAWAEAAGREAQFAGRWRGRQLFRLVFAILFLVTALARRLLIRGHDGRGDKAARALGDVWTSRPTL
jgi:hypothetical protein